jgi:hypothetical protein
MHPQRGPIQPRCATAKVVSKQVDDADPFNVRSCPPLSRFGCQSRSRPNTPRGGPRLPVTAANHVSSRFLSYHPASTRHARQTPTLPIDGRLSVPYPENCPVKRSRALLASNPTRDSRAGGTSTTCSGPGGTSPPGPSSSYVIEYPRHASENARLHRARPLSHTNA